MPEYSDIWWRYCAWAVLRLERTQLPVEDLLNVESCCSFQAPTSEGLTRSGLKLSLTSQLEPLYWFLRPEANPSPNWKCTYSERRCDGSSVPHGQVGYPSEPSRMASIFRVAREVRIVLPTVSTPQDASLRNFRWFVCRLQADSFGLHESLHLHDETVERAFFPIHKQGPILRCCTQLDSKL